MSHDLLIAAAQTHQPPLPHIAILGIVAIAVVGWLLYGAVTGHKSRARDSESERGPERTRSRRGPDERPRIDVPDLGPNDGPAQIHGLFDPADPRNQDAMATCQDKIPQCMPGGS